MSEEQKSKLSLEAWLMVGFVVSLLLSTVIIAVVSAGKDTVFSPYDNDSEYSNQQLTEMRSDLGEGETNSNNPLNGLGFTIANTMSTPMLVNDWKDPHRTLLVIAAPEKPFDAEEVKQQMGIAREKMEQYKSMAQFLGKKRYTAENVTAYFNDVFGKNSRNASLAHDNLQTQPGAKYGEGSWWQAFNAVTYMTDHLQGRENDSRLVSAWYGRNRKVKLNALDKALEYAEVA